MHDHLLRLLAVAARGLPDEPADEAAWHATRSDLLRPAGGAPGRWTRRARCTAGALAAGGGAPARTVPDCADEDGVDPARGTETYVELAYVSTDPRWAGARFVLRTGETLAADHEVVAHLRAGAPGGGGGAAGPTARCPCWSTPPGPQGRNGQHGGPVC